MRHSKEKMQPLMVLVPQSATPIWETVSPASLIVETATPQLIDRLSFTHFFEFARLEQAIKANLGGLGYGG
ncbi:MAG: hypothetical protein COS34_09160 [Lysobacterales bacterium CG02_land_8_20_14_3_00_62_12]|nr:MAG: hypothetical protein COS34_09160 [Xanthomonadales bacterium CG02_land_8_20_14_3_00_62_12]